MKHQILAHLSLIRGVLLEFVPPRRERQTCLPCLCYLVLAAIFLKEPIPVGKSRLYM